MEFLLLIIIAGFAIVGVLRATRHRRANGYRAFGTTGRPQEADSDPTYYSDSGGHHHSSDSGGDGGSSSD